jgi:hypothetical protein
LQSVERPGGAGRAEQIGERRCPHVVLIFGSGVCFYGCCRFGRRRFGFVRLTDLFSLPVADVAARPAEKIMLPVFLIATFVFTLGIALLVGVAEN